MCCKKNFLSYILKKKKFVFHVSSFLVINVCNQGKSFCSPCILWTLYKGVITTLSKPRGPCSVPIESKPRKCQSILVGIMMAAGWTVRNISTSPEAHPTNYSMGTGVLSLGIKRPGCEVVRLPLFHLMSSLRIY